VEVRLLGPLEVLDDELRPVVLGPPRQRALLAALCLHFGEPLGADRLIDLLWNENPPASAATILHGSVAGLRKVLEPDRGLGAPAQVLVLERGGYRLDVPPSCIDCVTFERVLDEARRTFTDDAAGAERSLAAALSLWRGRALDGMDADFAVAAGERLEASRIDAIELRAEARLVLGQQRAVIAELESIAPDHPFRERMWGVLIAALYYSGRAAESLQWYERLRTHLTETLGVDPSPPLRALYAAILQEDNPLPGFGAIGALGPPSGVPTFLLVDIAGSSELWERNAERMSIAHQRFQQITRECVRRHRGMLPVEQGEGDSAVLVFGRASDAVAGAIDLQRTLGAEDWPAGAEIKIRAGLHTGEAELRDGTYYGPTINRCARLRELGHGGQVLLSAATADIVSDVLPDGAALVDLGLRRLRNMARAEHVWQLAHPTLERHFPPLRGAVAVHNLPQTVTGMVGRVAEREAVHALLVAHRLVTLTGPGGSGKTRLAIEVARMMSERVGGGVWLVELAPLTTGVLVVEAVAGVVGVRSEGGRPLIETLCAALADDECLLVLDNCEHVIDASAVLSQSILRAGSGARILTTSREPLAIPGEVAYPVGPLPVAGVDEPWHRIVSSEAARLFAERAAAARPGFAVDESNAGLVGEICRRLDGMPLALELAAARVASMPLGRIAERLDDRFRLLESVTRAAPERHRSLEAAVQWSYDLLSDDERALFDQLSVFAGTFTLQAVERVVEVDGGDAAELLAALVSRSLVQLSGDDDRYRILESLREFGRGRLVDRGVAERVRERHARYYADVAEAARLLLRQSTSIAGYAQLDADEPNLRDALTWAFSAGGSPAVGVRIASALWFYWDVRGADSESSHWVGAGLSAAAHTSTPQRAILLAAAAMHHMRKGEYEAGNRTADDAIALVGTLGHEPSDVGRDAAAFAAWPKGISLWARGNFEQAQAVFADAAAVSLAAGDIWFAAQHEFLLGRVLRDAGDVAQARDVSERALARSRDLGERQNLGLCCELVASLARLGGDVARARMLIDEALGHYRAIAYSEGEASVLAEAGRLALETSDTTGARSAFGQSFELCRRMGHRAGMAAATEGQARVFACEGNATAAATLFTAASALRDQIKAPLPAALRAEQDRLMAGLEDQVGRALIEHSVARGLEMTIEELADLSAAGV